MCLKIMGSENKVSPLEIRFAMVGGTYSDPPIPKPDADWMSKKMWCLLCEASDTMSPFKGLP